MLGPTQYSGPQSYSVSFRALISVLWWFMQEKLIANNYYLNKSAKDAYKSYILACHSHSMKDIFNVHRLNLQISDLGILAPTYYFVLQINVECHHVIHPKSL